MNLQLPLFKNRLNLFLLLAFVPLLPIQYFAYIARGDVFFGWIIPFYGFLLLLIKKDKLAAFLEAHGLYRVVGLALVVASVFAYYAVAPFYPSAQFYGVANYTIYVLGLFLVFFKISALKESFAPVFLIVAATASPFVGKWMESFMQPTIPYFMLIMDAVSRPMGVRTLIWSSDTFLVYTRNGGAQLIGVSPGCIGIYSFLTFSVIVMVTMMEDSARLRTRLLWSIGGIVGTFLVNVLRVSIILWFVYYYGGWEESVQTLHGNIGYILFLVWLGIFFLSYSKRQSIQGKLQAVWRKLRPAK